MVLTDRQRADLHAGIYEYLHSRPGDAFAAAAQALAIADPSVQRTTNGSGGATTATSASSKVPLLEKKWTAIPRLQKKVLELERAATQAAKMHAHRPSHGLNGGTSSNCGTRRMLPRPPCLHTLQGHTLTVTCVSLHPIYTMVASGSEDGTIKLWDHESGEYLRTLKGHTNAVNAIHFAPSGTHLVSCSTDLSIKLWDVTTTYNCVRTLRGHDHTISCVRFWINPPATVTTTTTSNSVAATPGAQMVVSASRDYTVKVWDVDTGYCEHTHAYHTDWVRCLAIRPSDGSLLASAGNDTVIVVYERSGNALHGTKMAELRGHEQVIETLSFLCEEPGKARSNNVIGRDYLVSGSRDRTVRLWHVLEQACLHVFAVHDNWVRGVALHFSGLYIVSCADDKTIRVLDIKAQRCLRTISAAHEHFCTSLDLHATLPVLVTGSVDHTIKCWQLD